MDEKIADLEKGGLLGENILGTDISLTCPPIWRRSRYLRRGNRPAGIAGRAKLGHSRLRPPFPAVYGLFGKPTVINNVETLTNLPLNHPKRHLLVPPVWHRQKPGIKIFSLSGG
jgi:NADH-quinone oxidoreductase subunit F